MDVGLQIKVVTVTLLVALGVLVGWSVTKDGRGINGQQSSGQTADCPCDYPRFCERIADTTRKEIFVFSLNPQHQDWRFYDWNKVTTVVMVGYVDLELVCLAHKHGARVVGIGNVDTSVLPDPKARASWIQTQLAIARTNYLDGINIDYESSILANQTALIQGYTSLIAETTAAFKAEFPTSMVTVDVAWSPGCIDRRCYDFVGLSKVSDFLFVMSYDEQSQIQGKCIAKANSPVLKTRSGVMSYLEIGIPADKLVLGIPWYGYYYQCLSLSQTDECTIKEVPFLGVNCSDAAGKEIDYSRIIEMVKTSTGGRQFDTHAQSPYFNYKSQWKGNIKLYLLQDPEKGYMHQDPDTGIMHQVRYDDPQSLTAKMWIAIDNNLRGVGVWNAESVNYTSTQPDQQQAVMDMWGTFPDYKTK